MQQEYSTPERRWRYHIALAIFWCAVFVLNAGPHWEIYSSARELIETAGLITGLQMLMAWIVLRYLVPRFLDRKQVFWFVLWVLLVTIALSEINIVIRVLYLEIRYPDSYTRFLDMFGAMSLLERMDLRWAMRYILFTKLPEFVFPAVLIAAYNFYAKQQTLLQLKEQKVAAELNALKSQLNPHFIFNTLNNIYALALKKSDQTPAAIEQLSGILDYVVYRCNQRYVALEDELALVKNYMALVQLRFGQRLQFTMQAEVSRHAKIAPLILLTLLENACKHGAEKALKGAEIKLQLSEQNGVLHVELANSKPPVSEAPGGEGNIGLQNLRQQLALLYPGTHQLRIDDGLDWFTIHLSLPAHTTEQPER